VTQDEGTEGAVAAESTGQGPTEPLVTPNGYDMKTALTCTYLVDVASSMCIEWMGAGSPSGWSARRCAAANLPCSKRLPPLQREGE
jgi:hypothetical protein